LPLSEEPTVGASLRDKGYSVVKWLFSSVRNNLFSEKAGFSFMFLLFFQNSFPENFLVRLLYFEIFITICFLRL